MPLPTLRNIIDILAFVMVPIALATISVRAIQRMIRLYQLQSFILALLTMLRAFEFTEASLITRLFLSAFAVLIPGLLVYIIEPLLALATVPTEGSLRERMRHPLRIISSRRYYRAYIRAATPVWLDHGLSPARRTASVAISLLLIVIAYVVAFDIVDSDVERAQTLAVAMTLLMLGIFTIVNRQDLISQIVGLLVMDHGLFLAVVRFITLPALIPTFVVSLFLYILITLLILVILLPELHAKSETIEVADQKTLRG